MSGVFEKALAEVAERYEGCHLTLDNGDLLNFHALIDEILEEAELITHELPATRGWFKSIGAVGIPKKI